MSGEPASQRYFLSQLSVLADGMKGLTTQIARQVEAIGRYDVEFIKLGRSMIKFESDLIDLRADMGSVKVEVGGLRTEMGQFRSNMEYRLDAILKRIDDLEGRTHDIADHVQELRSDSLRQYNEVINAVQDSYQNRMSLEDIEERLAELERIVLSRQPPAA
jgi:chromosome segregation ATPase